MIITPIDELRVGNSIMESNKKRIEKIVTVGKINIGELFNKVKDILNNEADVLLKYILENEIFFEIISDDLIYEIIDTYNSLEVTIKSEYINCLRESYKIRGEKGINFSWGAIVMRYKGLARC